MKFSKESLSLTASVLAAILAGCMTTSPSGPSTEDIKTSDAIAAEGNSNLNGALNQMLGGQFKYGEGNLDSLKNANANFEQALALNPGNNTAKFGAAVTGVLLAGQSPGISTQVNNTLEAGSPLDPSFIGNAPLAKVQVLRRVAAQAELPEFHEIQDSVAAILLPALEKAIGRLQDVYNDPAFSLTLTIDGHEKEIDHAEVGVMLAGFKATHALATLLLSYDVDVDQNGSYAYLDTIGHVEDFGNMSQAQKDALNVLTNLLKPGSPFLAVKPAWQARLDLVDDEINSAVAILKESLSSVKNETGDQSKDILHLCSNSPDEDCQEDEDFDEFLGIIDSVSKYLNQPYALSIPEADTTIQVSPSAILRVQDYKKILPFYAFYNANEWSDAKPVLYFTNAGGAKTWDIKELADYLDQSANLSVAQVVAQLKTKIYWQDPTFQGFLPGATSDKIWRLIQKLGEHNEGPLAKRAPSGFLRPHLALSLLGGK